MMNIVDLTSNVPIIITTDQSQQVQNQSSSNSSNSTTIEENSQSSEIQIQNDHSNSVQSTNSRRKRKRGVTVEFDLEQNSHKNLRQTETTEEKRTKPFRNSPTSEIKTRIQEALSSQQVRLIKCFPQNSSNPFERIYVVLGSTGNVYNVTIGQIPKCTCVDATVLCKHILFIYLRVLSLNQRDSVIWQESLLKTELQRIFSNQGSIAVQVWAPSAVIEKYLELTTIERTNKSPKEVPRKPLSGECPICHEELKEEENPTIVYCKYSCGNNLHRHCFERWRKVKSETQSDEATCVYCRARWDLNETKSSYMKNGYLNLSSIFERERNLTTISPPHQIIRINLGSTSNLASGFPIFLFNLLRQQQQQQQQPNNQTLPIPTQRTITSYFRSSSNDQQSSTNRQNNNNPQTPIIDLT